MEKTKNKNQRLTSASAGDFPHTGHNRSKDTDAVIPFNAEPMQYNPKIKKGKDVSADRFHTLSFDEPDRLLPEQ